MEEKLGRFLLPEEIVHHKDRDESNDSPDNLEIMSQQEHIELHRVEMQQAKGKLV